MNAKAVISFADCKIYLMGHSGQMPCFPYVSALCLQNLASISFNQKMAPLTWTHNSKVTLSPLSDQRIYVYQSFSTLNSFLHSQFTPFTQIPPECPLNFPRPQASSMPATLVTLREALRLCHHQCSRYQSDTPPANSVKGGLSFFKNTTAHSSQLLLTTKSIVT